MLVLVLSQMWLCWTGICRKTIAQLLIWVLLTLINRCGGILISDLSLRKLCSLWALHTVRLFLVGIWGICILFLHLLWSLLVEACLFFCSLHTFFFLRVHLVHFSWGQWLLVMPMMRCFFLWCLHVWMSLFLFVSISSVLKVVCKVLMQREDGSQCLFLFPLAWFCQCCHCF